LRPRPGAVILGRVSAEPMTAADPTPTPGRVAWWRLVGAGLVSVSGIPLFAMENQLVGLPILAAGLIVAGLADRGLLRHLALVAVGMAIISTMSLKANLTDAGMARFAITLTAAVVVPYLISRFVYRERIIRFPLRGDKPWSRLEWVYLVVVLTLGYLILPIYFIRSEVYLNWPAVPEPDLVLRLLVGVNFVGLWDELFFICTVFALLKEHFPMWQANLLQSVIFTSFLWDIGYQYWGPLMTFPFALLQGYVFHRTKSLPYVLAIHLTFDMIIWAILVEAHNPGTFPIFITQP
jgi:membrane protease YdiL (CAAX protease family)